MTAIALFTRKIFMPVSDLLTYAVVGLVASILYSLVRRFLKR